MTEHRATIPIGPQGLGRHLVPGVDPGGIEGVRVHGPHGYPHVQPDEESAGAWLEVLGAVPDRPVVVSWRQA